MTTTRREVLQLGALGAAGLAGLNSSTAGFGMRGKAALRVAWRASWMRPARPRSNASRSPGAASLFTQDAWRLRIP